MEFDQTIAALIGEIAVIRHRKRLQQRESAKQPKDPQKALEKWKTGKFFPVAKQKIVNEALSVVAH